MFSITQINSLKSLIFIVLICVFFFYILDEIMLVTTLVNIFLEKTFFNTLFFYQLKFTCVERYILKCVVSFSLFNDFYLAKLIGKNLNYI